MYQIFAILQGEPQNFWHKDVERCKQIAVELSIDMDRYGDLVEVWTPDYKETILKISYSKYPLVVLKGV